MILEPVVYIAGKSPLPDLVLSMLYRPKNSVRIVLRKSIPMRRGAADQLHLCRSRRRPNSHWQPDVLRRTRYTLHSDPLFIHSPLIQIRQIRLPPNRHNTYTQSAQSPSPNHPPHSPSPNNNTPPTKAREEHHKTNPQKAPDSSPPQTKS